MKMIKNIISNIVGYISYILIKIAPTVMGTVLITVGAIFIFRMLLEQEDVRFLHLTRLFPAIVLLSFAVLVFGWNVRSFLATLLAYVPIAILDFANGMKVAVTGSPLSTLDIFLTAQYPEGLFRSIGFDYGQILVATVSLAVLIVLAFIYLVYSKRFFYFISVLLCSAVSTSSLASVYTLNSEKIVDKAFQLIWDTSDYPVWSPEGHAKLSLDMGVISYMFYFEHSINSNQPYALTPEALAPEPISMERIKTSFDKLVPYAGNLQDVPPDIFIVHLESIFDPKEVFDMKGKSTNLLYPSTSKNMTDDLSEWASPVIVNTIGGNSWISEFEVITGLDSRLFGLLGRYTHSTLSHLMKSTLATHLADLSYKSTLYTETTRDFYNYGNAYDNYGFDTFIGIDELKVSNDDIGQMKRVLELFPWDDEAPQLSMILLSENHSPHNCRFDYKYLWEIDFASEFSGVGRCTLQEYDRRARNAETAVLDLLEALRERKKRTGKEFLVVMYGDHQPFTFTGGGGSYNSGIDFSSVRSDASLRLTFSRILASYEFEVACCSKPIPLTFLPTLLSALVAPEKAYQPVGFFQQDQCSGDFINVLPEINPFYTQKSTDVLISSDCKSFKSIVSNYLNSGYVIN